MTEESFQLAYPNVELRKYVQPDLRGLIIPYSIELEDDVKERLAQALAKAVELIAPALQTFFMVTMVFGEPSNYGIHVGTGMELYYADMSQDPVATAGGRRIYLHAQRIADSAAYPVDVAVVTILEELIHVWMNVKDEEIAKYATANLHGDIVARDGRYLTKEQFWKELTEEARVEGDA